MKTSKLIYYLRKWYPISKGCVQDYIGLQTGKLKKETNNILLCLDFDDDVFNQVKNKKIDLILTHHPLIYGKRKEVLSYDKVKSNLVKKIDKLKIPVYSMHTNFDGGDDGMNFALANKLNLKNIKPLINDKLSRGGTLPYSMNMKELSAYVKKKLNLPFVYYIDRGKNKISKVAICGGAGSGVFKIAMEEGYDAFISGDAPHHIRHDINCYKFNYIEIMHEVEQIFITVLKNKLNNLDKNIKIITVEQKYPKFN